MKRILMFLMAGILVILSGAAAADSLSPLSCFQNGTSPEKEIMDWMYSRDEMPASWEYTNGILYDTATKTLLKIPDETDCGKTLTVETGTLYICFGALNLNETVEEIYLPDGLEVIGQCSLTGATTIAECTQIRIIHVPASVRLIREPLGTCMYSYGCGKPLFLVDEGNPRYMTTPEGMLIDKLEGTVLWCASSEEPRVVTVPDGIRRIAPYAFAECNEIISIQLPDSVIEIGEGAFSLMAGLKELTIPASVLYVANKNFNWVGDGKWVLDKEGNAVKYNWEEDEEDQQEITAEEALRAFGVDRKPGITFKGTEFRLLYGEDEYYSNFEECLLPIECPAEALSRQFMEDQLSDWIHLNIVEADGSVRQAGGE